ncbi:MAG: DUF2029 domain-containing protein [Rhodobacteraceae bacterium]|nr:DUF2029 domain-containing protein [Paracoccaceae bacterium]
MTAGTDQETRPIPAGGIVLPTPALPTALAIALLVGFCAFAARLYWTNFPTDLSALYMAGWFWSEGLYHLVYDVPTGFFGDGPPGWLVYQPALGLENQLVVPYVYPPLWAALLAPLSAVTDPFTFFRLFMVAELAMIAACVPLAWRLCRGFAMPLWAWLLAGTGLLASSVITIGALMHLQPQIIVVFLILFAFERYASGHSRSAGALLALAAAMKLAPAALALIFLADRDSRALAGFAGTGAALAGLSLVVAGVPLHLDFLAAMAEASAGLFATSMAISAETLIYGTAMVAGLAPAADLTAVNFHLPDAPAAIPLVTKAILVACLVWLWLRLRPMPRDRSLPAGLFALSLLINLFGPLGWSHYYLLQLFLLPGLVGLFPPRLGALLLFATALATSGPAYLWLRGAIPGDLLLNCAYAGIMLTLFVVFTASLRPQAHLQTNPN